MFGKSNRKAASQDQKRGNYGFRNPKQVEKAKKKQKFIIKAQSQEENRVAYVGSYSGN